VAITRALYERFRQLIDEFAKFVVIGVAGVFITNAVSGLLLQDAAVAANYYLLHLGTTSSRSSSR
jgi:putative flippase GtrA